MPFPPPGDLPRSGIKPVGHWGSPLMCKDAYCTGNTSAWCCRGSEDAGEGDQSLDSPGEVGTGGGAGYECPQMGSSLMPSPSSQIPVPSGGMALARELTRMYSGLSREVPLSDALL